MAHSTTFYSSEKSQSRWSEMNEVLVRVRAASVHPDVWHVVTGRPYVLRLMGAGVFRPKNPVPGTDVAGLG